MNIKKAISFAVMTLAVVVSFQNCSNQKLSTKAANGSSNGGGDPASVNPGGGPSTGTDPGTLNLGPNDDQATGAVTQTRGPTNPTQPGPNCRNQLHSITTPIKTVFVVDVSGSNYQNNGGPGSDPNRVVRGDSIERYFNTYKLKNNFGWSFSTFAGGAANILLAMGNATSMANAIATFRAMLDGGETPYIAALNAAKSNIANDVGRTSDTRYMVVFLSDGLPNPVVDQTTLNNKVTEIVNTVPGKVSFNAIYYGATDATASNRLQTMAQVGGGNFLDTNMNGTGTNFLITDLVLIPGVVCN